jgi:hypothetical protein
MAITDNNELPRKSVKTNRRCEEMLDNKLP